MEAMIKKQLHYLESRKRREEACSPELPLYCRNQRIREDWVKELEHTVQRARDSGQTRVFAMEDGEEDFRKEGRVGDRCGKTGSIPLDWNPFSLDKSGLGLWDRACCTYVMGGGYFKYSNLPKEFIFFFIMKQIFLCSSCWPHS